MGHDIFICHAHADINTALAACAKLEEVDVRCWIAPRDVGAGPYARQIARAITDAAAVLLIFSDHTNTSGPVLNELEIASKRQKPIIPFRIEDVAPNEDLEYYTLRVHWLDALRPPMESRLDELVAFVQRLLAAQPFLTMPIASESIGDLKHLEVAVHGPSGTDEKRRVTDEMTAAQDVPTAEPQERRAPLDGGLGSTSAAFRSSTAATLTRISFLQIADEATLVGLRGIAGILFGITELCIPAFGPVKFGDYGGDFGPAWASLFIYACLDSLIVAYQAVSIRRYKDGRWKRLMSEGVPGLLIVISVFAGLSYAYRSDVRSHGFPPSLLLGWFSWLTAVAWFIVSGFLKISAAIRLRRTIANEWYLVSGGVASIGAGVILAVAGITVPGGLSVSEEALLLGTYGVIFGLLMIALSFRLRRPRHSET